MAVRESFDLERLEAEQAASGDRYREFLRVPALSCGLYVLPKDAEDLQSPHSEDEVYYVLHGRATMDVGDHEHLVHPGSVVYVPAGLPHRFHSIEEDLKLLVVFAPAEGSWKPRASRREPASPKTHGRRRH